MNPINELINWFAVHPSVLISLGVSSIFIFIMSLIGISWVVGQIPADYFLTTKRRPGKWKVQAPFVRIIVLIIKNIIGLCFILGGVVMLVLPGQGLLTIITGLLLVDYPGKFQLERKIVAVPSVLKTLNWMRSKSKKLPLRTSAMTDK